MHGNCTVWVSLWKLVHNSCTAEMYMTPVQLMSFKTTAWQLYSLCVWQLVHDSCTGEMCMTPVQLVSFKTRAWQLYSCVWFWRQVYGTCTAGIWRYRVKSLLIDSLTCLFYFILKTSVWHLYSCDLTSETSVKSLLIDSLTCLFLLLLFFEDKRMAPVQLWFDLKE